MVNPRGTPRINVKLWKAITVSEKKIQNLHENNYLNKSYYGIVMFVLFVIRLSYAVIVCN